MPRFDYQEYALRSPAVRGWVNQCGACGRAGVKPEAPAQFTRDRRMAERLRRALGELALDARGRCPDCAELP